MAIEKIKILGAILELPAKQHCQFSPFGPFSRWIWWIGSAVYLVAPKRPTEFWFFQLPWVLIIHLSLFPLSIECPNLYYKKWDAVFKITIIWIFHYSVIVENISTSDHLTNALFNSISLRYVHSFQSMHYNTFSKIFLIVLIIMHTLKLGKNFPDWKA